MILSRWPIEEEGLKLFHLFNAIVCPPLEAPANFSGMNFSEGYNGK